MLRKAHDLEPGNKIYDYLLASFENIHDKELLQEKKKAALEDMRKT